MRWGVVAAMLWPAVAVGQTEGALAGTITDAEGGAPVAGAVIELQPGGRGGVSDSEGRYLVRALRPGTYRVLVRALGYAPASRDTVRIQGNRTVVLDIGLRRDAVLLAPFVVEVRPDPVLDPRIAGSTQTISAADLRELPVTTLDEAVALQAGVVGGSYRGGRVGQDVLIVDGMGVKNQLDASSGGVGVALPTAALQEASLVTNGFSARFGQALSGMVNVVTRDGGERLEGGVAYETDRPLGDGADVGLDRFQFSASGPVGVADARFLVVLDARARVDDDPVNAPPPIDPLDPRSARPWVLPHASGEALDLFAKLTLPFADRYTLRLLGLESGRRRLLFDPQLKYEPNRGPAEGIGGRFFLAHLQRASRPDSTNATIFDVRIGHYGKEAVRAPLLALPDAHFGAFSLGGFEFAGRDLARRQDSLAALEAIAGFATPRLSTETPWGVPAFFYTDSPRGELAWNRFRETRARLDAFFGRGPDTDVRTGVEGVFGRVETFTRLEAYRSTGDGAPEPRRSAFSPFAGAAYVELTQRFSDLTLNLGLRADLFDARSGAGGETLGGTKIAVGPRLGVATTLNRATVMASFGRFAQAPDFQYLVDAAFDDSLRTGRFRRGNASLGFETSTQYELQLRLRASEVTALRLGAFVKRLDGLVASIPIGLDPDSSIFGNGDFGDVRGLEVMVEREDRGDFGARVSYVLQVAEATASDAFDFFRRLQISPIGDTVIPAVVSFPLDFDRRHALIAVVRGRIPADLPAPLVGFEGSLVARWSSGLPYTRTNLGGDSIVGLPNAQRMPSQFGIDLRLSRTLELGPAALAFYIDVRNLTNRRNVIAVRKDTGSPAAGTLQIEQMAEAAWIQHPEPIPYESPAYRPDADLDGDGLVAGRDELLPMFERAARDFLQPLFAYGPPRLVRLGFQISW